MTRSLLYVFLAAALAGCASLVGQPQFSNDNAHPRASLHGAGASYSNLYVANRDYPTGSGFVTVYAAGSAKVARRISERVSDPESMGFDSAGNLYVMNRGNQTVTVYAKDSTNLLRALSIPNGPGEFLPENMVVDASGNVYVSLQAEVAVFGPGSSTPMRTITNGIEAPILALDSAGNLYAVNSNKTITIYLPGAASPSRTVSESLAQPTVALIDSSGNLYVTDDKSNSIVVFNGADAPSYTITTATAPARLALDGNGNLFVSFGPSVMEYAPGKTAPSRTITGIRDALPLVCDSSGNVYVGDGRHVRVYAPGQTTQLRVIRRGIHGAAVLAFGP